MKIYTTTLFVLLASIFFSTKLSAQIPNNGFEDWVADADGILNPTGWETINSSDIMCVEQYIPAYKGNYSMLVKAFDPGFIAIGGVATIAFPFTQRPAQFTACLKTTVMPGDAVYIIFSLWKGDSLIAAPGNCTFKIDSTINNFTCLSFPIYYQSTLIPDSANIMVVAGTSGSTKVGTQIIVDELSFGSATGIGESSVPQTAFLGQTYPNPTSNSVFLPINMIKGSEVMLHISDIRNIEVRKTAYGYLDTGEHIVTVPVGDLPCGVYHYTIRGNDFAISRKFVVSK